MLKRTMTFKTDLARGVTPKHFEPPKHSKTILAAFLGHELFYYFFIFLFGFISSLACKSKMDY